MKKKKKLDSALHKLKSLNLNYTDIKEDLDIKKLISKTNQNKLYLDFNTINVDDLIKILVGHEVDLSSYKD